MNKTRSVKLLLSLIFGTLMIMACSLVGFGTVRGSGNVVEESRTANNVTSVELATLGNLTIEVGDSESFRIEAEDNLLEYLETEVLNGNLRIETRNNISLHNTKPVNYYLTVTSLDAIKISSSGDIQAPNLEADDFSINISSSGNLVMGDLDADELVVRISSSGDVTMGELNASALEVNISSSGKLDIAGGRVESQNIAISSSGIYTAEDLESGEATVRLSSSGSATIWVQDSLGANLSSSGNLYFRGNPKVNANTSSSGDVIQIGE